MVTKSEEIEKKQVSYNTFEEIKRIDEKGNEYWYAKELMRVL